MLRITFSSAIAVYLCFSIFLVLILWIFYNYRRSGILNETKYLQQCPYCTYLFFDYRQEKEPPGPAREKQAGSRENGRKGELLICPRCQSYIHVNEGNTVENKG